MASHNGPKIRFFKPSWSSIMMNAYEFFAFQKVQSPAHLLIISSGQVGYITASYSFGKKIVFLKPQSFNDLEQCRYYFFHHAHLA